jgi:hypothetical protein
MDDGRFVVNELFGKDYFGFASDGLATFPTDFGILQALPAIYMPTVQDVGCMTILHDIRTDLAFHRLFPFFSFRFVVKAHHIE